jgi:predicted TIM-barrel fold metal-dependent hydrolase
MKPNPLEKQLLDAFEKLEVIDAHEHLPPEPVRTGQKVDVFTLFCHYTAVDLGSAGMGQQAMSQLHNAELPLEYRWRLFAPYLEAIRYGSYARPAFIAAREFYGVDDINEKTYQPLSQKMQAANTPGIYQRILRDKCRIRTALTQCQRTDYDLDLLVPLMPLDHYAAPRTWEGIQRTAAPLEQRVNTLDDYLALLAVGVARWKSEGVVGIKMVSHPSGAPDRAEALSCFESLRAGREKQLPERNPLRDFLTEEMLEVAADQDLTVAVHAGMWGDFRAMAAEHMIPIVPRHPRTRFDLYHMGMPETRDAGLIGKNFPNVWLNMCWSHVISQKMATSALDEWLDLVPVNKLIAFGGDYNKPVEKVYGALVMAREDIARVLAGRIADGQMTESEAAALAKKWFFDNPRELYRLKV